MSLEQALKFTLAHEDGYAKEIEDRIRHALFSESSKYLKPYVPINSRGYICSVKGCKSEAYAKGFCNAHYMRDRLGKDMNIPIRNRTHDIPCVDCGKPPTKKNGGWMRCQKHYKIKRRRVIKDALISVFGGKCKNCGGIFHPSVYDFHHKYSKDESIAYLLDNASIYRIAKEIIKCELICANCHRIEHNVY